MNSDAPITKKDLDSAIAGAVESISEVIGNFANQVDARFNQVDARFNQVDARFSGIENEIAEMKQDIIDLNASHERLLNTVDAFVKRIDDYETEQAARDSQFAKLLEWARKVSEKTGIPLENL